MPEYYKPKTVPCIHIFNSANAFAAVCCATLGHYFALSLIQLFKSLITYAIGEGS